MSSCRWFFGLIAMCDDIRFTMSSTVATDRVQRHRSSAAVLRSLSGGVAGDVEQRRKYLKAYLDSIFPSVFRETKSGVKAMWEELKKHHRYANLFTAHGPTSREERAQTIVQLLTVQTMLMFLMAVFYDLEYPTDNGLCKSYFTKTECLAETSIFDSSKTLCTWKGYQQGDGSTAYQCIYIQPSITIQVIVLISILIACGTAPINFVVSIALDVCSFFDRLNRWIISLRSYPLLQQMNTK
jgi:hypothetical protein